MDSNEPKPAMLIRPFASCRRMASDADVYGAGLRHDVVVGAKPYCTITLSLTAMPVKSSSSSCPCRNVDVLLMSFIISEGLMHARCKLKLIENCRNHRLHANLLVLWLMLSDLLGLCLGMKQSALMHETCRDRARCRIQIDVQIVHTA
jgi:hypothetical protein